MSYISNKNSRKVNFVLFIKSFFVFSIFSNGLITFFLEYHTRDQRKVNVVFLSLLSSFHISFLLFFSIFVAIKYSSLIFVEISRQHPGKKSLNLLFFSVISKTQFKTSNFFNPISHLSFPGSVG